METQRRRQPPPGTGGSRGRVGRASPRGAPGRERGWALVLGCTAAFAISAVWIGLTALTGKTYHLAPVLAAMAPGLVARADAQARFSRRAAALSFALGLVAVALGWVAIEALDLEPTATLVGGQSGGVLTEVVVGAVLGAVIGAAAPLLRARWSARGVGS